MVHNPPIGSASIQNVDTNFQAHPVVRPYLIVRNVIPSRNLLHDVVVTVLVNLRMLMRLLNILKFAGFTLIVKQPSSYQKIQI
jgi:hypothetical protein